MKGGWIDTVFYVPTSKVSKVVLIVFYCYPDQLATSV